MTILKSDSKINSPLSSSEVELDSFISRLDVGYLPSKAIETLSEIGVASHGMEEHESILNAIYYLVAELEENHMHAKDKWSKSGVFEYIQNMKNGLDVE